MIKGEPKRKKINTELGGSDKFRIPDLLVLSLVAKVIEITRFS